MGQQGGGDDPRWFLHPSGGHPDPNTTARPHSKGARGRGAYKCGCGRPSINQQRPWRHHKLNSKFSTFSAGWRERWRREPQLSSCSSRFSRRRRCSRQYYQQHHHHSHQQQQQQQLHHKQQKQRQPRCKQPGPPCPLHHPPHHHHPPPPDHLKALPGDPRPEPHPEPPRASPEPAPRAGPEQWERGGGRWRGGEWRGQQQAVEQCSGWRWAPWWFPRGTSPPGWWAPTVLLSPAVAVFSSGVPQAWWWQLAGRVYAAVRAWTQSEATE